jgi:RND family efflux transporter MFP subunit
MDKSELLKQLKIDREEPPPASHGRWLWILLLLAMLGGAAWWLTVGKAAKPVAVKTATVVLQAPAAASILDATGYVVARRRATVSAKITGKIAEVFIEEGQRVKDNEILAKLDSTDANAQLKLAQSQLDSARSQLADLQVQLAQAQRDLSRQDELIGRKLTSTQAAEQARANVDSLKARLSTQHLQIEVAEQSLRFGQVNVDNTVVRSPFAGVIVAKTAQPGEIVSPMSSGGFTRTGIGTIVDMDSLEIEVDVNESYIGRVQPGQPIDAKLNAYPDWAIPAEVIAIIPTADRSKATVKVRIAIKLKDPRIVPEMGVRVAFLTERQTAAKPDTPQVLAPASAIRQTGDTAEVFVLADGIVRRQVVKLGGSIGENRQILSGLRGGERLVLEPAAGLKDGDKVENRLE